MRHLIAPVGYYLLGLSVGVFAGMYWPPAHRPPAAQYRLIECKSDVLRIVERQLVPVQTPGMRTASLLVERR